MAAQAAQPLHILFFPSLGQGHLLPIADMAALFASRGVRCTILTSPVHAAIIRPAVDRANHVNTGCPAIDISVAPDFPDVSSLQKFRQALDLLRKPFHRFLADSRPLPDAVVSDAMFHWSTAAAAEHGVPRLAFHVGSMFARCCIGSFLRLETTPGGDDDDLVSLPGLPHRIELRRSQMMDPVRMQRSIAADQGSFGVVINSFHELERDYVQHFQGHRAWLVGPVSLACKDMAGRGAGATPAGKDACLEWLDTKQPGSVVYVSFGTLTSFSPPEQHQIARGLHLSGKNFLWVVAGSSPDESSWMPPGFAELITPQGDRGFIVRGWAPQMLVLNHPAIGAFLTHCGWNSTLEAASAGVPMVTWPRYADQFYNEKLVVEVLKVGVSVGAKDYASADQTHEVIAGEVIAESIRKLMGCSAIQNKAKHLGVEARKAVENGGSSYDDVGRLIDELMLARRDKTAH